MATLINMDGSTEEVFPENGKTFTLAEVQKLVGGYIQVFPFLIGGRQMLVDEDGLLRKLPVNSVASAMVSARMPIVGPALLVSKSEFK